jgi:hypothetical protein
MNYDGKTKNNGKTVPAPGSVSEERTMKSCPRRPVMMVIPYRVGEFPALDKIDKKR